MHDGVGLCDATAVWGPATSLWMMSCWCSVRKPNHITGFTNLDFDKLLLWSVTGAHLGGDAFLCICPGKVNEAIIPQA